MVVLARSSRDLFVRYASIAAALSLICARPVPAQTAQKALLDKYCVSCHSEKLRTGGLSLENADLSNVPGNTETWEKVIRKVRVGAMPPRGLPRPDNTAL